MTSAGQGLPFSSDAEAIVWCARLRSDTLRTDVLGRAGLRRRNEAFAELSRVFQAAPAPKPFDGNTDIGLVAAPLGPPVDAVVRLFFNTGFWLHKKFDASERRGINGFPRWFRPLAPLVFPRGGFFADGGGLWGVRFSNELAQSLAFPGKEVFTIDYRDPGTTLVMRPAVDEAVQISPNVSLCLGLAVVAGRPVKLLWFTLTRA
ncbi:MAG: hypothetical protein ACRC20_17425 [Segniliparus sp.]|uniref:hypothetical protein n=1 Tax=Segniliparus sp. TaxID=2804064 RepID=UPI003F2A55EF